MSTTNAEQNCNNPGTGTGTGTGAGTTSAPAKAPTATGNAGATVSSTAVASSKNLLQRLPAGAVLAFQALAATFTNQGHCYRSNWWLTVGLVTILSSTCIFFSFTDSLVHNGKVYYGVAVPGRLNILNMHKSEERIVFKGLKPKLRKRGLKPDDWVHAFLSLVVFLTIAASDVGLQNCFFPKANDDTKQLLKNLPLGMAVMSSFLFMIFPTTRKGIRFDNGNALAEQNNSNNAPASTAPPAQENKNKEGAAEAAGGAGEKKATDRAVMSSVNLMQLLPTGPVLAFQTLAASFTNQGQCYRSNWWLTVGLVVFLSATCIFSSFTDCIPEPDKRKVDKTPKEDQKKTPPKVHKGVALPSRLHIIGMSMKEQHKRFDPKELKERRLRRVDWIHAFFSAVVFLTIAGSDVGLQNCFFPNANDDTRQMLKNLPLGMAVMSSFVFIVFPTTRNSFCFDDSDDSVPSSTGDDVEEGTNTKPQTPAATTPSLGST